MKLVTKSNGGYKAIASLLIFQTLFISLPETLLFADPIPQASPESNTSTPTVSLEKMMQMGMQSPAPSPSPSFMPMWGVEPSPISQASPSPSPSASVSPSPVYMMPASPAPSPSSTPSATPPVYFVSTVEAPRTSDGRAVQIQKTFVYAEVNYISLSVKALNLQSADKVVIQRPGAADVTLRCDSLGNCSGAMTSLTENTNYNVRIAALDMAGNELPGALNLSLKTLARAVAITGSSVEIFSTSARVSLQTMNLTGTDKMVIRRAGAADVVMTCNAAGACGPSTLAGLNPSTDYSITVVGLDKNGKELRGGQVLNFKTSPLIRNISVTSAGASQITSTGAFVSVTAPGLLATDSVSLSYYGLPDVRLNCSGSTCTGNLSGLIPDTIYNYFRVIVKDKDGNEMNAMGVTSFVFRTLPARQPVSVTSTPAITTANSADLKFNVSPLQAGDVVLVRRPGAADVVLDCSNPSAGCKGTVNGLSENTTYTLSLIVKDKFGADVPLNGTTTISFKTKITRSVSLTGFVTPAADSASANINTSGLQAGDKVIARRSGFADVILTCGPSGQCLGTLTGLSSDTNYAVNILVQDSAGKELGGKITLSFKTLALRVVSVQLGSVEATSSSAQIRLAASPLASGDRVLIRRPGLPDVAMTCSANGSCTGDLINLNADTIYSASIVILDKDGKTLTIAGTGTITFRTQPVRTAVLRAVAEPGSTEATVYLTALSGLNNTDKLIIRRPGSADIVLNYDVTGRYQTLITGLNPLTDYNLTVFAVDKDGKEINGRINLSFRTQPMRAVTLRAVAEPASTSATVFVTALGDMQNTDKLIIRRAGAADIILNYDITGRYQVTLNGLNALTDYNVTVLAIDKNGRELNGKINLSFRTLPMRTIGVKVSALETTTTTATVGVKLLNPLASGDRVIVRRPGAPDVVLSCNPASICQGTISGLIPNSNYSASIVILDKDGKPLTLAGITTFSFKTQPSLPIRVDQTIVMNDQAKITWSKDPDAVLYWVQIHDAKTGKLIHEGFPAATNETFAIYDSNGKIYPEGGYIVTVRPSYTARVEDGKLGPAVQAPMYVDFSNFRKSQMMLNSYQVFGQNGRVTLSWQPVPDARVYWVKVYSRIDGKLVYEGFPATTSESFTLPPGSYSFEVTASLSKKVEDGVLNKKAVGVIRT